MKISNRSGFSLIEMLVVITIVAILIALITPSLRNAREVAMQARCGAQLRSSGNALMTYAADFKEWGPTSASWDCPSAYFDDSGIPWVENYFGSGPNLQCPTDFPVNSSIYKVKGGLRWRNCLISSYNMLFGLGISYNDTTTSGDWRDVWYGWRIESPAAGIPQYAPLPRLTLLGRKSTYRNVYRNKTYEAIILQASEQPIAVDGWLPTTVAPTFTAYRVFYGAGPDVTSGYTGSTPDRLNRPIMHQYLDGSNILFADGHVAWRNDNQMSQKLKLVSGNSIRIYW